jgi:spore coat protein JB
MKHHGGYNDECYASCNSSGNGGNSLTRLQLLGKIQELDFAKVETGLYLDAYPDNRAALAYYNKLLEERRKLSEALTKDGKPLTHHTAGNGDTWSWVSSPWTWELEANL